MNLKNPMSLSMPDQNVLNASRSGIKSRGAISSVQPSQMTTENEKKQIAMI